MFAGKKGLAHFVAAVIPALQDGQLFAEALDGLSAGNKRLQRSAYAGFHALRMGCSWDCCRRRLRLTGLQWEMLRWEMLRLASLLRGSFLLFLCFHCQMRRPG